LHCSLLAVVCWQLPVASWQLLVGSCQLPVGSWQLAVVVCLHGAFPLTNGPMTRQLTTDH
jgi:hypothetical protein